MKIAIRYYSRGGNVKKMAKAVSEAAGVPALPVSQPLNEDVDLLFLCSALYAGNVDDAVKDFIRKNTRSIGKVVNVSSSASKRSTYKKVEALFQEKGVPMTREEFYCPGSFLFLHRNRPNEEDLADLKKFVRDIVS